MCLGPSFYLQYGIEIPKENNYLCTNLFINLQIIYENVTR